MPIECVPNVSEARRPAVVRELSRAIAAVEGVRLLDVSSDADHNRSVFTFVGESGDLETAVLALAARAVAAIDLRTHAGVHPRIGAVDVVPFVPLSGATMAGCVALARGVGAAIADRFELPVYLYEEAASRPERRRLENIRRGGLTGLAARIATPEWAPDFGPPALHPSAGACVVGARRVLIAFNVNLATNRIAVARRIASVVRESGGGLPGVKALGLAMAGRHGVQVSINLTDYTRTPLAAVFDAVVEEAARDGIGIVDSELIGLLPRAALAGTSADHLRIRGFSEDRILEHRLAVPER